MKGKRILITGASSGIGAETARFLAENNTVFIHYNSSESKAKKVAEDVTGRGGTAQLVQADISSEAGCLKLFNAVKDTTDSLDVLINNAGGALERYSVVEIDWDRLVKIFSLNTFSVMRLTALLVPLLQTADNSCIVNITSVAARSGAPTATIYGAAKGALDTFTRGCAKELAPNVRVNSIAPGVIETPFHDSLTTEEKMQELRGITPLKRNGEARQVAHAVKFLIENDFITGECIDVNGGLSMR